MKKHIKLLLIFLMAFIVVGCMTQEPLKNTEEIKIGIVETAANKNKSVIHWYDENLEEIDMQKLKYASLGASFTKPVYDKDEIYLIPKGLLGKKDAKKVISINKEDFTITEYDVPNIALQDVAVIDDYLFVNSNLNFETHLSRVNRETRVFDEEIYEEAYFESMLSVEDKLFLFGTMERDSEDGSLENYLYIFDTDFNLLETVDLTDVGFGAYKYLLDHRDLYVSIPMTMKEQPNSILLKINVDTLEKEVIDLEMKYPDSLVKYKEQLFIAHSDIVTGEGSMVTVLNPITHEKENVDLKMDIYFMDLYEKYLVVLDDEKVALFDIENDFGLLTKVLVNKEPDTYLSNIIIIDKK